MNQIYTIDICGRKEDLPVMRIGDNLAIAFFNLHGNQDLTEFCGKKLAEVIKTHDAEVLITAESKGLQLTHVVARELNQPFYAVVRKTKKLYMQDGVSAEVKSITTGEIQTFYLSAHDQALIKGKRVCIVDDVVSTGGSLLGLKELVEKSGGEVILCATVLAEGDAKDRKDLLYLAELPLFPL